MGKSTVVEMQYLARQGLDKTAIGNRLGFDRKTVSKYLKNPDAAGERKSRESIIDPFKPYLIEKLEVSPTEVVLKLRFMEETETPIKHGRWG